MTDKKISALTGASTPIAGTEVIPIVQSNTTKKIASDDLTVKNVRSNATTGILQVAGPAAGTTRTMTTPDANFTAARTDAAQTFTGTQTFSSDIVVNNATVGRGAGTGVNNTALGQNALNAASTGVYNTAIGDFALATLDRNETTAIGFQSGYAASSSNSVYVGGYAGFNNTGARNTFIGYNAGNEVTTGAYNTIIGGYDGNNAVLDIRALNNYAVISDSGGVIKAYGDASDNWVVPSGNVKLGTAGKGIDFSANTHAAGMTSELLDWYEEGTWTPGQGGGVTVVGDFSSSGTYTRIGRQVTINFKMSGSTSIAVNSGSAMATGIPFAGATDVWFPGSCLNSSATLSTNPFVLNTVVYSAEVIPAVANIHVTITYMV